MVEYEQTCLSRVMNHDILPNYSKIRSSGTKWYCSFFFCLSAIPLSDDHKPNRRDERERIESAGGVVMWAGKYLGLTI